MSTILNRILIIVFAIIFLISGGLILRYFLASRQVEQQYDRLALQFHQAEKKEKSRTSEDEILPQYKELLAQNSDLVGWISIEGTGIDYPVVQAIVVLLAAWIMIVNFAADLVNYWMDPRRRNRS